MSDETESNANRVLLPLFCLLMDVNKKRLQSILQLQRAGISDTTVIDLIKISLTLIVLEF